MPRTWASDATGALLWAGRLRNSDDKLGAWIAGVDLDGAPKLLSKSAHQPHSQSLAFVRFEICSDANSFDAWCFFGALVP